MSGAVNIDLRPFVSLEAEAQITRSASGVPELRPMPGVKASARWLSGLARILGKADQVRVVVRIEREKQTRSTEQNALYWVGYVGPLLDGLRQNALDAQEEFSIRNSDHLHRMLKNTFLPKVLPPEKLTDSALGLADDLTTTTLSTEEFGRYLTEIAVYASGRGIYLGGSAA